MYPKKEHIINLASKWERKTLTTEEERELNAWYQQGQDDEIIIPADFVESEEAHELRIWNAIEQQIESRSKIKSLFSFNTWRNIAAAAAVILIVGGGIVLYSLNLNKENNLLADGANDIAPGANGATLTLANGKKIRLANVVNGEVAEQAGVVITKSADGKLIYQVKNSDNSSNTINTLSTNKGETYQVRLPDGSVVYLNAASSLTYAPSLMENGKRVVKLKGEGYFEISKDKNHPFVVQTNNQEVEVLGTHFNIMAYADEPAVATSLLEGSVKISANNTHQILKPNEQALNNGNVIQVKKANLESVVAWKDGDFYFDRLDFKSVMRKISRWYDVEVIYEDNIATDVTSSGWISRNNKLSSVLESIEKSGQAHFKIEDKKVYVTK